MGKLQYVRRPSWTRPFIEEPVSHTSDLETTLSGYAPILPLVFLSLIGLSVQIAAAVIWKPVVPLLVLWAVLSTFLLLLRPRTASLLAVLLSLGTFCVQGALIYAWKGFMFASPSRLPSATALPYLSVVSLVTSAAMLVVLLNMPFRDPRLSRKGISKPFSTPNNSFRSPEDNLTIWQWLSVSWMAPMLSIGTKRKLDPEDVWSLPYEFQHAYLHEAFRTLKGSVVRRLIRANWFDLVIMILLSLLELGASYSSPLILQQLLRAMERLTTDKAPALFFTFLTLILRYVSTQSSVISLWYSRRCYERSRGEMITMIYEKTLHRKIVGGVGDEQATDASENKTIPTAEIHEPPTEDPQIEPGESDALLNGTKKDEPTLKTRITGYLRTLASKFPIRRKNTAKDQEKQKPATMGKILNMMRNDTYEVAQRFWDFPQIINQPIGFVLSFVLIWRLLGWPCLFGIGVVVLAQIGNAILAKIMVSWETIRRKATDTKLQQVTQYIEAIRHLRYYGWQNTWLNRIMDARQKELNLKIITNLWNTAILFVNTIGSGLLPVAAFWAYTSMKGDRLTVDIAFPALQLFSMLQGNLRIIPSLITTLLNAAVAVGRIEDFMKEPDKEDKEAEGVHFGEEFETKDATFAWPDTSKSVLKNLSLTFPNGLTVIYGQVAAGKSALLQALLGELDLQYGDLVRPLSAVAYCSQTPWLQSMSIRENILLGSPYDDERYKETLHACALLQDLASFQHGDLSPIGENGIGLSGGQKMRVALARAVYSRADTLLLDDPLSALDQQTAEHIVQHCLKGSLLKGRTVILVTHRVDLCIDVAEQLVELTDGEAKSHDGKGASLPSSALSPTASRQDASKDEESKKRDEAAAVPEKFEDEEHRADGSIQAKIYLDYLKAGGLLCWVGVLLSSATCRVLILSQSWYLKEWSEAYKDTVLRALIVQNQYTTLDDPSTPISRLFDRFPNPDTNPNPWLIGLMILVIVEAFCYMFAMIFAILVTYTAGKHLFKSVMQKVSGTNFRFYDVTPVGRLMNRLTSDMGTVDGGVSNVLLYCLWQIISWGASVSVIALVTPTFLVAVLVLTTAYVYTISFFIPTSQSLRRLEMVSLSPLMSNFGALLEGLMTVRAFGVQQQFQSRIIQTTDAFQQMDHFYWSLQAWLMWRFDLLSAFSTLVLTLLAIYSGLSPGLTAFMLVAAGKFVQATHALCRVYGTLQLDFVAVERVVELLHLDQEKPGDQPPPASWPTAKDDIVFEDVTVRYAADLDPALKNISFTIPGGSSTALIGRTGSGKSTLALALLATTPPDSGRILIGGIDISKVEKYALRSRITFLAQDPVLFPGSLRHNLDPIEDHTDEECIAVLDRVCGAYGFKLDTEIDTGGKNLSQGQRQLVGLARAILRRSSIIIMDEATASIDRETAWEIQRVLREELVGSTVITIAHRPSAVRGADLCIKLASGQLVAQGKPDDIVPGDGGQTSGGADRDTI